MIQANELRVGNYAYYKYWNPRLRKEDWAYQPVIVTAVSDNGFRFVFPNKKAQQKISVLHPIPLTEEILLNCGFRDNDYYFNNNILFFFRRMDGKYVPQVSDQLLDEIKYLHQLQNLYFALTGKELEINL